MKAAQSDVKKCDVINGDGTLFSGFPCVSRERIKQQKNSIFLSDLTA